MTPIILSTLNARYIHSALGLRYLYANLQELQSRASIIEFTIDSRPIDIVEKLLKLKPQIIGFGVYIWNIEQTTYVVSLLKKLSPETIIILGGPEVSYEYDKQPIVTFADHVITGNADLEFYYVCKELLNDKSPDTPGLREKIIQPRSFQLSDINFPYTYYSRLDIANRVIYVEASRGCPFKCEFCLSALDKTAWPFDLALFLAEMQKLYERGARQFKFVDRTFNLKTKTTTQILEFFLGKLDKDLFLHFELIPDHLPDKLKSIIQQFPEGSLQFEIGIQTFNSEVQQLISRKQDNDKAISNLTWLRNETHAHLHTDLIVGLPGEDLESIAKGFNQLIALNPHEIQVGILKRLRGTPVIRHTDPFNMVK
ncbi:B12-binding domain-containing radical SAM protein, partial [Kaarinaea lacus]